MSNIAPIVSFKKVTLKFAAPQDTKTRPVFEDNPHIDHPREMLRLRDRYGRLGDPPPSPPPSIPDLSAWWGEGFPAAFPELSYLELGGTPDFFLSVDIEAAILDTINDNKITTWFENEGLLKYLRLTVIQSLNEDVTDYITRASESRAAGVALLPEWIILFDEVDQGHLTKQVYSLSKNKEISQFYKKSDEIYSIDYSSNFTLAESDIMYTSTSGAATGWARHLTYFIGCYLDVEEMTKDYGLEACTGFSDVCGPLTYITVVKDYTLQIIPGILSRPIPETVPAPGARTTNVLVDNEAYFSSLYHTYTCPRDDLSDVQTFAQDGAQPGINLFFSFDEERIKIENCGFDEALNLSSRTSDTADKFIRAILSNIKFNSLLIYRQRVDVEDERIIMTEFNDFQWRIWSNTESDWYSGGLPYYSEYTTIDPSPTADADLLSITREHSIFLPGMSSGLVSGLRHFSMEDRITATGTGTYQYDIEVIYNNNIRAWLLGQLKELIATRSEFELYFAEASLPCNYGNVVGKFNDFFIRSMRDRYKPMPSYLARQEPVMEDYGDELGIIDPYQLAVYETDYAAWQQRVEDHLATLSTPPWVQAVSVWADKMVILEDYSRAALLTIAGAFIDAIKPETGTLEGIQGFIDFMRALEESLRSLIVESTGSEPPGDLSSYSADASSVKSAKRDALSNFIVATYVADDEATELVSANWPEDSGYDYLGCEDLS